MIWRKPLGRATGPRGGEARLLPAIVALAAALSITLALLPGGAAQPAQAEAVAQTPKKTMWGPAVYEGRDMMPTYRDLGVGIYATTAHWDQIAPTKPVNPTDPNDPAYTWPSYITEAIPAAAANGIRVQILIRGTPPWANGGRAANYIPTQISDWADFVTAVAKKYPTVNLWMIWGEPNRGGPTFAPFTRAKRNVGKLSKAEQVAPRNYAQLLDTAYGALKAINPNNLVIGGNTYTAAGRDDINTYQWIRYMKLPSGQRPRMDLYGHNPYGFDIPNLKDPPSPRGTVAFADLRRLVKVLDKAFKGQRLKLYLSEWGVPIGFKDKDLLYSLKPKEGKRWIRAGLKIARKWKRVYTLGWVHPIDTSYASQGLLNRSLGKKPGYNIYKKG
ncbi:MAG: cellulase family glycosylhydrolase [Solirubrobacterales bacterium]